MEEKLKNSVKFLHHAALFDQHFISFDANGHILIHETINRADYRKLALEETMQIVLEKEMKGYMKAHRKVFGAELHKVRY